MGRDSAHSRATLQLEILALRHQLHVLERSQARRRHLTRGYRLLGLACTNLGTVADDARHRQTGNGVDVASARVPPVWTWKSRHNMGRPTVPREIRALIRTMSIANPLWGAPRIHGELLKLGLTVSQTTVAKYVIRSQATVADVAYLPREPHAPADSSRFLRGPDGDVPTTFRSGVPRPRSPACRARCGDGPSHGGVDGATTAGSLPLGRGSTLSHSRPGSCIRWCACKR